MKNVSLQNRKPDRPSFIKKDDVNLVHHMPKYLRLMISLLLAGGFLGNLASDVSVAGKFFILSLLILIPIFSYMLLSTKNFVINLPAKVIFLFIALILANMVGFSQSTPIERNWIVISQIISISFFVLVMTNWSWTAHDIKSMSFPMSLFIAGNFMLWIGAGRPASFQGLMSNSNVLGGLLFFSSFYVIASLYSQKISYIYKNLLILSVFIDLICIWSTNTRSTWLSAFTAIIIWFFWGILKKNRTLFFLVVPTFFFFSFGLLYFYINSASSISYSYTDVVSAYSGKRLNTGRQLLWPDLIDTVAQEPFFGHGAGFSHGDLSAHNLFIELALQTGVVGLIVFLLLIWALWNTLWSGREDPIVRLSGAFFLSIFVHQMFEVSFTQNNLSIGLLQWTIIIIGVSRSMMSRRMMKSMTRRSRPTIGYSPRQS